MSGPEGILTPVLLSAIEIQELSTMSTAYIWLDKVHTTIIYGGQNVQEVHYFHAVLPALHPVSPGTIGLHPTRSKEGRLLLFLFV